MSFLIVLTIFILAAPINGAIELTIPADPESRLAIETFGDIVLGGLFLVHSGLNPTLTEDCSCLNHDLGIHLLEAMMYAVDMINNDASILANYTVGVNLRDTCGQEIHGLEESVHFIHDHGNANENCSSSHKKSKIFGVVGAGFSGVSMQVANLLGLFHIPQISYASTSPELNDRENYAYFFRTVPSDEYRSRAMVDVIRYYNWSSVFGIYSEENYGTKGMGEFVKLTKTSGICMVGLFKVNSKTDFGAIIKEMSEFQGTRVVVLFMSLSDLSNLLTAVKFKLMSAGSRDKYRFKWVGSDFWGTRVDFIEKNRLEDAAEGAITLSPQTVRVLGFESYFRGLSPENNTRNPWFTRFWEEHHNCSLSNNSISNMSLCTGSETLLQINGFDSHVPYVIDAVYAFAHAINELIMKNCIGSKCKLAKLKGDPLVDILKGNFSFIGQLGRLQFDKGGSTVRGYDIHELFTHPNVGYKKLGSWFHKLRNMTAKTNIRSFCSSTCKSGQIKVLRKAGITCCFICRDCGANQYIDGEGTCKFCNKYEFPNASRTGCQEIAEMPIFNTWSIVLMVLSAAGIIATVIVIFIFVCHNDSVVVKASGRELSYPLLFGIILCYVLPFIVLAESTETTCGIKRFASGFPFFICYTALLIKTIRIERIFKKQNSILSSENTCLKPSSQVLIFVAAVLIEVVLAFLGLLMKAPRTEVYVDEVKGQKVKICVFPLYDIVLPLLSDMLLIILCIIFAFRTRKVPACFNEAKYIGLVMYTTFALWIAFVTIYFGMSLLNAIFSHCIVIFLSATSILVGVFGPKIYIILFRAETNIRDKCRLNFQHTRSHESHTINGAGSLTKC